MMVKMLRNLAVVVLAAISTISMAEEKVYYTQSNIWLFKDKSFSTNYAVDVLVPVNSKVKINDEDDEELELVLLDGNVEFVLVNIEKHSKQPMAEIKRRVLGEQPVDLNKLSALGKDGVKSGQIKLGMTKAEVLVARGYPPGVGTLNTDSDVWKFWRNKFDTQLVTFKDGKVSDIKD